MQDKCPVAWSDTYDGHWVAASSDAVFELACCPYVSNDHDVRGQRKGYKGINVPTAERASGVRGGILEMDEPEHSFFRSILNPYLSPAAVKRCRSSTRSCTPASTRRLSRAVSISSTNWRISFRRY